jgi:hypothetical protein
MPTTLHHHSTAPPTSGLGFPLKRAAPTPFPAHDHGIYELMPAERACRYANLRATLRQVNRAHDRAQRPHTEPASLSPAAARLKEATKHYQQHVLAWYALSRVNDAHAAREAITHCQLALAAENPHTTNH